MDGERQCRLFFALWPDPLLRDALEQRIWRRLPVHAGRRVPVENLHITLVFIGNVPESRLACIERAGAAISGAPFTLRLDRIAWWRHPRVLWLGPTETPPALMTLVAELHAGLKTCGIALESRPFRAHMTLMREASRRPPPLRIEPLSWRPDGIALIESIPVVNGVRYHRRAFWPLACVSYTE